MKKIIIIAIFFCFGCTSKTKEFKYQICRDSIQYWNYEWPHDRSNYYGFTLSFDSKGNIVKYSYDKEKNKRRLFTENQDKSFLKWTISEDSIFTVMGSPQKIIRFSEDTIYVYNLKSNKNVSFVRVKGNLNIIPKPIIKINSKDSMTTKITDL